MIASVYKDEHYESVRDLLLDSGWTNESVPPREAFERSTAYVVTEGNRYVGYVRILTDGVNVNYVAELVVAAGWKRKGIGRYLLSMLPVVRTDLLSTAEARGFYESVGFTPKAGYRRWPQ